jgi:KDEL-tailed cysteine endopeptidase
MAINKFTDLTE